jgi:hypothetical protein
MADVLHSIRYPFAVDMQSGALAEENNYSEHVKQMIMQVLFTNPGERINRPDFGCGLRQMVFAPNSATSANMVQILVYQALQNWLADVINVVSVTATANEEKLLVSIQYALKVSPGILYLNVEVAV